MSMLKKVVTFFSLVLLMSPLAVSAHSGRTNVEGCHTNRKTGDYHCHEKKIKKARTEARTAVRTSAKVETRDLIMCEWNAYNCSDFSTQTEAQQVFEYCGVDIDIHDLDRDSDGVACEVLR